MRAEPRARLARAHRATVAALACALCAQACSGRDVVLGAGRAPADAAAPSDADGAPPDDQPIFSDPVALAGIAAQDADDDDPSLSADLTLLYFNSEREGGAGQEDIWFSSRAAAMQPWQPPEQASALNTEVRETGIALAADGLAIWWSSDREGGAGGLDVYRATRASRDAPWSAAEHVPELSGAGDDLISAVTDGERTVLLARRADGDDDYDLFVAYRNDRAQPWNAPQAIAELNSDEEESDAFLLASGTELLFTRDEDLQLARRTAAQGPFDPPVAIDALNSDADDRDAWASEDFGYVVFSSDRSGTYQLYEASR